MNKQFNHFLTTRKKEYEICNHPQDYWCQNCVFKGKYADLRSHGLGHGHIISNFKPQENNGKKM